MPTHQEVQRLHKYTYFCGCNYQPPIQPLLPYFWQWHISPKPRLLISLTRYTESRQPKTCCCRLFEPGRSNKNHCKGTKMTKNISLEIMAAISQTIPDSKVHGTNMGPTWGRQDPGGPHVGPMNCALWDIIRCIFMKEKSCILVKMSNRQ